MTDSLTKMPAELKTLRDWMRWATSQFRASQLYFGHGTDNAWDEAVYLVLHALHLPPDFPAQNFDCCLTLAEQQAIFSLLQRRLQERLPAPYLTHEAWFADLPFYVDNRVLIPRSPLAELIQQHFSPWIAMEKVKHILEIGTGSGCIAIACAHAFPEASIVATDISVEALAVAKQNVVRYHLQAQIQLQQSDVFAQLPLQQFDVIISNPPYVDAEDMADLPPEYHHEPRLALAAGEDGLTVVSRILANAADYLTAEGILIVEVGNSAGALEQHFPHLPFTWLEFTCGDSEIFVLTRDQLLG